MALDCTSNYTGPAIHILDGSFATNFIFTAYLLLFTIPIWVQVVTICDRLHLYKWFNVVFKKIYCTLQAVYGLCRLAMECHQLHTPNCRLKKTATRPRQQPTQTLPPLDEYIQPDQSLYIMWNHHPCLHHRLPKGYRLLNRTELQKILKLEHPKIC